MANGRVPVPDPVIDAAPQATAARAAAGQVAGDVGRAVRLARELGASLPLPAVDTLARWSVLAAVARCDVTAARVLEAHCDAVAILAEAGRPVDDDRVWGVFAAEGGPDPVRAEHRDGSVTLTGTKPWCSLGGVLDAALITARVVDDHGEHRRLYAVDLRAPGVQVEPATGWVSRGLPEVVSVGIALAGVPAEPVGGPQWYLQRPGFTWGGMGVAACWYGAARGVADLLWHHHRDDDLMALHRGRVDVALHAAACVLVEAARRIDDGSGAGPVWAERVRAVVADCVDTVLREVGHAAGPAPLAFDEPHAARVADLTVYVRQHHGERDLAALGRLLTAPR